ncbi:hypothetical protein AN189_13140 [Loktanella sp. 3ANDIMAR09]|uniref:baseplate J/gp47 family protein n=1 Tax=Loktanella sp. 3ANDIMAR09 TaxID=1225657 RepID=UPI000701415F|nr:baseplate J/gp47 family protein [Loktanella sp. 3ANDIMAR09]KQI68005.1 hypothetical protein AN189_13140 [Loktanella sp. 3ANDIMAR09]
MSDRHPIEVVAAVGAPQFVTTDAEQLLRAATQKYEQATGRILAPSQVETYILEVIAYMLSVRGAEEQFAIQQNMLAFATGNRLDEIGAGRATLRQPASASVASGQLSGNGVFTANRAIPAGTRIQFGNVRFVVAVSTLAEAGSETVDVDLIAEVPGPLSDQLSEGDQGSLVDPLPELTRAVLTSDPSGGVAAEPDAAYRVRIAQAWEKISRGGSRAGYQAVVRDWDARVIDVNVDRPTPGVIRIVPLMSDGPEIGAQDKASLLAYLADDRTPQGDDIQVASPTSDAFTFDLTLVVSKPEATAPAEAEVVRLLDDWRLSLGGQVIPSDLIAAAKKIDGVIEADVLGLAYRQVAPDAFRDGALAGPATVTVQP